MGESIASTTYVEIIEENSNEVGNPLHPLVLHFIVKAELAPARSNLTKHNQVQETAPPLVVIID